jgi:signal transduction histidine kinase
VWWRSWQAGYTLNDLVGPENAARLYADEPLVVDRTRMVDQRDSTPYEVRAFLMAPMRVANAFIGVLAVDHGSEMHDYADEEVALTSAVAKLAALVLDRERALEERAQAEARELALAETNRRINDFLMSASHELKTPLTTLSVDVQQIARQTARQQRPPAERETQSDYHITPAAVGRMQRQVLRLKRLVNDLLEYSRISGGKQALVLVPCDLGTILHEMVEEQRTLHPQRVITVETPSQSIELAADEVRIGQVVSNYLTNALKYSEADRPVEVTLTREDAVARVSVRDQGPGLPPEEQERIWERFHQAAGITAHEGPDVVGLGLGLHISKDIIERHGGRVGVESEVGKGSSFWFTLTLEEQAPDTAEASAE